MDKVKITAEINIADIPFVEQLLRRLGVENIEYTIIDNTEKFTEPQFIKDEFGNEYVIIPSNKYNDLIESEKIVKEMERENEL